MNNHEFFPSVFADSPSPLVSNKYQFIRTSEVLETLSDLGWSPREMSEVKARKPHTRGFQKHLVRLTNPGFISTKKVGDEVPEIVLTNSHNGKNSFSFRIGIYRLVCSNGLVIPTEEFENITVKHVGNMASQIQEVIERMSQSFSAVFKDIQEMKSRTLTPSEIRSLSREALKTRSSAIQENLPSILDEILAVQREEDDGNDLWKVYNRIQENLMSGNFEIRTRKGSRKATPIKSIDRGIRMNEGLWTLAKSYL